MISRLKCTFREWLSQAHLTTEQWEFNITSDQNVSVNKIECFVLFCYPPNKCSVRNSTNRKGWESVCRNLNPEIHIFWWRGRETFAKNSALSRVQCLSLFFLSFHQWRREGFYEKQKSDPLAVSSWLVGQSHSHHSASGGWCDHYAPLRQWEGFLKRSCPLVLSNKNTTDYY